MSERKLRLLCIDGGGVRGLSALYLLEQLLQAVNPEHPPLPHKVFDMIGGTSTGGLIAIMLGLLKMSVQECIYTYLNMMDEVFRAGLPVDILGRIRGKFSHRVLEAAIKRTIRNANLPEDALMRNGNTSPDCRVFVCTLSVQARQQVQFSNYAHRGAANPNGIRDRIRIWEAARATSAAPTFFDPMVLPDGQSFVDGGMGKNNPVEQLWLEALHCFAEGDDARLNAQVQCLVSLGTGRPEVRSFKASGLLAIGRELRDISTDTEETAKRFREGHVPLVRAGRYFRLSVDRGLENIGMEDRTKQAEIASRTMAYGEGEAKEHILRFADIVNNEQRA